jgi:diketogulonate reductase-like aldo/keto reductase
MKAMDELIEEWLIKNIWVSNFSTESLIEAQSYTKNKIVANQVHYNLIYREPEKDLLEYCQKNDVLLVAYRPLELWKLCNAWTSLLVDTAIKYNKLHSQISINYLTSQKNVVTLFKSSDKKHILENLWWVGWNLDKDDLENLRNNFSAKVEKSDTIPLW